MPSRSRRGQKRGRQRAEESASAAGPGTNEPSPPPAPAPEHDPPVPRDFGRDGISGLVTHDRALRAREVSHPRPEDEAEALAGAEAMLRRLGPRKRQ